jgi:signal transduction histidine kinase
MALDFLAAVPCVLLLTIAVDSTLFPYGFTSPGFVRFGLSLLAALALSAPVALRRRRPLAAFVASVAGGVVFSVLALVPGGLPVSQVLMRAPGFLLPAAYVIYLVAALYRRRTAVTALATVLTLVVAEGLALWQWTGSAPATALFTALVMFIFWIVGYGVSQRRAYARQLQDQAASGAVTEERLRIARELHDVVAHSMTVVAVQAGYGLHVIDGQPARAREALGAIQATSREALSDMRRMLGVLRQGGSGPFVKNSGTDGSRAAHAVANGAAEGGARETLETGVALGREGDAGSRAAPLAPAPGLADLGRLVARIANAGVRVDLRIRGERRELPPGIDLAAFRIVQEALTNVVKHAGVARCDVVVGYGEDELSVEIIDEGRGGGRGAAGAGGTGDGPGGDGPGGDGPGGDGTGGDGTAGDGLSGDGSGHGLIGMRERVSLYGGELSAAPRPGRGFRVAARLPVGDGAP